jgi:hypothetical protein
VPRPVAFPAARRSLAPSLLLLVLAIVCLNLCLPQPASAGEWVQRSCSNGVSEGWEGQDVDGFREPNDPAPFDGCLLSFDGGGLSVDAAGYDGDQPYAGELWLWRAPRESTIVGGTLKAMLSAQNGRAAISIVGKDDPVTLAACESPNCKSHERLVRIAAPGTQLLVQASCFPAGEGLCPSESGFAARATITSAEFLLATDAVPAASGFSGTLLADPASGRASLGFTATDPGPGVFQARVQIDGLPVWSQTPSLNEGECVAQGIYEGARVFNVSQPCPNEVGVSAEIPTASFTDGKHQLSVEVEDAAGNTSVVLDRTITLDNHPATTAPPAAVPAAKVTSPKARKAKRKAKPLTRAQKLAKALRTCRKRYGKNTMKRRTCEAEAQRKYGRHSGQRSFERRGKHGGT